jgi:hypothetical protein
MVNGIFTDASAPTWSASVFPGNFDSLSSEHNGSGMFRTRYCSSQQQAVGELDNRHDEPADDTGIKKAQEENEAKGLKSGVAASCIRGRRPINTLDPSSGGMGRQLKTASMMLIQTLATSMPTKGCRKKSGRLGSGSGDGQERR